MIRCQNSIVTVNVRSFHCQLQATKPAFNRFIWEIFRSLVDWSLWQVAPDNLKHFLEFGACFRPCFKLAVSLQYCTPHMIVHWYYMWHSPNIIPMDYHVEAIGFLWWNLDIWPTAHMWRYMLCMLMRRPAGRWIWWAVGNCLKGMIISKQNKLLFIKMLLLCNRQ